jgi:hypothetical protein
VSKERDAQELLAIVRKNGGGNFTASVYLREDGFFVMFNIPFMERIARAGRVERFCELLKEKFEEALRNAKEESNGSAARCAGENYLSGVQVGS